MILVIEVGTLREMSFIYSNLFQFVLPLTTFRELSMTTNGPLCLHLEKSWNIKRLVHMSDFSWPDAQKDCASDTLINVSHSWAMSSVLVIIIIWVVTLEYYLICCWRVLNFIKLYSYKHVTKQMRRINIDKSYGKFHCLHLIFSTKPSNRTNTESIEKYGKTWKSIT